MKERPTRPPFVLEVSSALLVVAASYGFIRLFIEREPVYISMASAAIASLLAAVMRRLHIPIAPALLCSTAALALVISQRFAPGTQAYGIVPTSETFDQLRLLATAGAEEFRRVRAPIPSHDSFVASVIAAGWAMATLTDWAAMRLRLAFEPVLPSVMIFGFASVLGSGEYRLQATIVFAVAIAFWTICQRWTTMTRSYIWIAPDANRGPLTGVRAALAVTLLALGTAVLVAPRLPGAQAEEIYSFRATPSPTRSPITPFVEIDQRLVEQSAVPLFKVESQTPQYWRVGGLETFADNTWTTKTSFREAKGDLDPAFASSGPSELVTYTVTMDNLTTDDVGEIWAPTAYSVTRVVESNVGLSWNRDNATLTIDGDNSAAFKPGDSYTLESDVPTFTADQLRSATIETPTELGEVYLALPGDLEDRVASEASDIAAGQATAYDQALALQDYFRAFDYSTDLGPRTSEPIDQFLTERIGFCQQFAGTYALMARSLGIPARVAIGYTWGDPVAGQEDTYQVRGKHAHAWPEVWLGEYGWVAFEPTPNRGAPSGTAHTGVDPSQDEVSPSVEPPADPGASPPVTARPINPADIDGPEIVPSGDEPVSTVSTRSWTPPPWLLIGVGAIALYVFGIPLGRRALAARRRVAADTPVKVVDLAWREASDELDRSFKLRREPAETRNEFADRAATDRRLENVPLSDLSSVATMVRYDPSRGTADVAAEAMTSSNAVVQRVHERVRWTTRWRRDIDPRRWRR